MVGCTLKGKVDYKSNKTDLRIIALSLKFNLNRL